jgi:hypothetical protein
LLRARSEAPVWLARMQDLFVPRSKPTRSTLRSDFRGGLAGTEAAGREAAGLSAVAVLISWVVEGRTQCSEIQLYLDGRRAADSRTPCAIMSSKKSAISAFEPVGGRRDGFAGA